MAYGLGKPCYAVGPITTTETLDRIFDRMFADDNELAHWPEAGAGAR